MKTTPYFDWRRQFPDRRRITDDWLERVISNPERELVQSNGRIACWGAVPEFGGRHLLVVLLDDRETVQNAFFDRSFRP